MKLSWSSKSVWGHELTRGFSRLEENRYRSVGGEYLGIVTARSGPGVTRSVTWSESRKSSFYFSIDAAAFLSTVRQRPF